MSSQISFSPQEFVAKWRNATLKERSASQEHFIDICRLIGHKTPAEMDPYGEFFTFEAGADKQEGGAGWADAWKKGFFAWEYKGKHADMDKAYQQLLKYRESLQNPPLLIVCDIDRVEIHTNFTNTVKIKYELSLEDLLTPKKLDILRSAFLHPEHLQATQTTEEVTREAAAQFSRIAQILYAYGEEPQNVAHFLIRILFSLFAEDVGLLPEKLFTRLVEQTRLQPKHFATQLRQLFGQMASGGWFGIEKISNFDGRLFDDDIVLELDTDALDILARVSSLDWSSIEPSIFGTLFERSLDPSKRSQLGAHYTSREDILLIVEPVLMEPLRRRWEEVKAEAKEIALKQDETVSAGWRTQYRKQLSTLLLDFAEDLATVQILDPACGSGNFLYVALRQLLDLWKEISILGSELGLSHMSPISSTAPSPAQLHGIELNLYAHQLAQATIWIGYIQWLRENGYGEPPEPILKPLDYVLLMDAILADDDQGYPIEPEWPDADVIIGNPPFLGGKKMRTELGDKYVDKLFELYKGRIPHEADLVCYWFEKAKAEIADSTTKLVGLLATQGIRGGSNRKVLERIKETSDIFWAQSDRDWILDGAVVHVSMIGFGDVDVEQRELDGKLVRRINADLTSSIDLTIAEKLPENQNLSFMGVTPAGPFDIPRELARKWLLELGNPNGKSNSAVLRPYYNGTDINRRPRNVWTIDFGIDMPMEEASLYVKPFEYIRENVYPIRRKNKRASYREKWWLYAETRPAMRRALEPLDRYIGTSMVSKHRSFSWIPARVLPANLIIVVARDDDCFLGVLQSIIHILWVSAMGTQLREASSGQRYTPSSTFETFPFPWPPGQEPKDDPRVKVIAEAARELVEKRDAWLNPPEADEDELKNRTLTNLYNMRPTWLALAHQKLDQAVFDAYGWPHDLGDEEIMERLLELNLKRATHE